MVRISLLQQIHFNIKDSLDQTVSLKRGLTVFSRIDYFADWEQADICLEGAV